MAKKRTMYTIEQRTEALARIANGEPAAVVAASAGINPTTIYNWVANSKAKAKSPKKQIAVKKSAAKPVAITHDDIDEEIDALTAEFTERLQVLTLRKARSTLTNYLNSTF